MPNEERSTERRSGETVAHKMAADAKIYKGTMTVLLVGFAAPGQADPAAVCVGIAKNTVDNTGGAAGDGDNVVVDRGTWKLANAPGADAITRADLEKSCYVVDAVTVAKTDGGGTRPLAGTIRDIDGNSVWVTI